jgi:hypothetical protein
LSLLPVLSYLSLSYLSLSYLPLSYLSLSYLSLSYLSLSYLSLLSVSLSLSPICLSLPQPHTISLVQGFVGDRNFLHANIALSLQLKQSFGIRVSVDVMESTLNSSFQILYSSLEVGEEEVAFVTLNLWE